MKGIAVNLLATILLLMIGLVVSFGLIHQIFNPNTTGYLGLPEGVWMEIESADTKTFVFPPVLWFGETLALDGNSIDYSKIYTHKSAREFIFPTNSIYIEDILGFLNPENFDYLEFLISTFRPSSFLTYISITPVPSIGTYEIIFSVEKPVQPNIAFYPLITDDFGSIVTDAPVEADGDLYYLKTDERYGMINLSFRFKLNKLNKYYQSNGYSLGADESEQKRNLIVANKTLEEWEIRGNCSKSGDEYICSFKHLYVDQCCPSFVTIEPQVKANLTGTSYNIVAKLPIQPVIFRIVYYVDKLNDRDYIFNNYKSVFSRYDEEVSIYPCRAIVSYAKFELLKYIDGLGGVKIEWSGCKGSNNYVRLKYKGLNENSTWYCKDNGEEYFLYNPYGFCSLVYNEKKKRLELPSFPKITYLQEVIPAGKFTKKVKEIKLPFWWGAWSTANINIPDVPYGTYREAASAIAYKVIEDSIEVLSGASPGSLTLFDVLTFGGYTIKYSFKN